MSERIRELLSFVYGKEQAEQILPRITTLVAEYAGILPPSVTPHPHFDHTDAILITYGDMVRQDGKPPLQTLRRFLVEQVSGLISGVHLLPFYPYSSDDGFSVIDYLQVDPALGDWTDVSAFRQDFRLMVDGVINHISQESDWYQAFLRDESPYTDYFTVVPADSDLSAVFRPRALPLLTPAQTPSGLKQVWTTFSADQIDLNYRSPDLLLKVLRVLLTYVYYGAQMIRLDAIGFMWKEIGTRCLHLPQAHALIQLMRAVLDEVAPHVALITETNVPHQENISYFGDGYNEAQMVYNFSLPPLILHAFHTGNAGILSQWASTLTTPSNQTTFFNFCASHDGIGLTPANGYLSDTEIAGMAARVKALGGFVSYKANGNGTKSAYELNINYLDALSDPTKNEREGLRVRRFLTSQAIMLALRGVPGIYFHSLFGSQSWSDGIKLFGHNRVINRQKLTRKTLKAELNAGIRKMVFDGYCQLLAKRQKEKAFNPYGKQKILDLHPAVFAVQREFEGEQIFCLHNVLDKIAVVEMPAGGENILTAKPIQQGKYSLSPYEVVWLKGGTTQEC